MLSCSDNSDNRYLCRRLLNQILNFMEGGKAGIRPVFLCSIANENGELVTNN